MTRRTRMGMRLFVHFGGDIWIERPGSSWWTSTQMADERRRYRDEGVCTAVVKR